VECGSGSGMGASDGFGAHPPRGWASEGAWATTAGGEMD
jgi:hypothetical protein